MNKTVTHIKYFSKLSAVFLFNVLKMYGIGILSTLITFILGIYVLSNSLGNSTGHSGAYLFLVASITAKPISASIFYLLMLAAPYVIGVFSMKYAISSVISKIVKDKTEIILIPFIDKIIDKFKTNQPVVIRTGADYTLAKIKLLNEFQSSSENKILKRIVSYALKKVKFDELNLGNENANFFDIIKAKLIEKLYELSEPSAAFFFIYIGLQWLSLILIYFLNL